MDPEVLQLNSQLLGELSTAAKIPRCEEKVETEAEKEAEVEIASEEKLEGSKYWHISLRFNRELLMQGMDPLVVHPLSAPAWTNKVAKHTH